MNLKMDRCFIQDSRLNEFHQDQNRFIILDLHNASFLYKFFHYLSDPTPDKPGIVVAYDDSGWEHPPEQGEKSIERIHKGPIPLKAVKAVYQHQVEQVEPGTLDVGVDWGQPTTLGRKGFRIFGKWKQVAGDDSDDSMQ